MTDQVTTHLRAMANVMQYACAIEEVNQLCESKEPIPPGKRCHFIDADEHASFLPQEDLFEVGYHLDDAILAAEQTKDPRMAILHAMAQTPRRLATPNEWFLGRNGWVCLRIDDEQLHKIRVMLRRLLAAAPVRP